MVKGGGSSWWCGEEQNIVSLVTTANKKMWYKNYLPEVSPPAPSPIRAYRVALCQSLSHGVTVIMAIIQRSTVLSLSMAHTHAHGNFYSKRCSILFFFCHMWAACFCSIIMHSVDWATPVECILSLILPVPRPRILSPPLCSIVWVFSFVVGHSPARTLQKPLAHRRTPRRNSKCRRANDTFL